MDRLVPNSGIRNVSGIPACRYRSTPYGKSRDVVGEGTGSLSWILRPFLQELLTRPPRTLFYVYGKRFMRKLKLKRAQGDVESSAGASRLLILPIVLSLKTSDIWCLIVSQQIIDNLSAICWRT